MLQRYSEACRRGDFTPLEEYDGFHQPYNDLALALMHGFFPFPFAVYHASQRSRKLEDRVVTHPWVRAGGMEAAAGEIYQSEMNLQHGVQCAMQHAVLQGTDRSTYGITDDKVFPIWAALLDIKVAYAMGTGIFARELNRGGPVRSEGSAMEMAKEAEFKQLVEEHQILSGWAARKFVLFARDPANADWVDSSIRDFGQSELDECPAAEFHPDDKDDPEPAVDHDKENGTGPSGGGTGTGKSQDARSERKRRRGIQQASSVQPAPVTGRERVKKGTATGKTSNARQTGVALQRRLENEIAGGDDTASDEQPEERSEYELFREGNIATNNLFLANLGIDPWP